MINANELRIGNKLIANKGYMGKVLAFERFNTDKNVVFFSDGSEHGIGEFIEDCIGVPLTEEILLKCGFQHHKYANDESFFEMQISKDIFLNYSPFHCRYILRKQWYGNIYNGNIEYLHQLQNLYFALTKTELEVNL
jgi:hypothetical protein